MKRLLIECCLLVFSVTCSGQSKNENQMKNTSTEIIRYSVPPEKQADFEKAYSEAASYLKQSNYCVNYQVLHGVEEPENYIIVINWTSREDHLNGFRNSQEFRSFFQLVR